MRRIHYSYRRTRIIQRVHISVASVAVHAIVILVVEELVMMVIIVVYPPAGMIPTTTTTIFGSANTMYRMPYSMRNDSRNKYDLPFCTLSRGWIASWRGPLPCTLYGSYTIIIILFRRQNNNNETIIRIISLPPLFCRRW